MEKYDRLTALRVLQDLSNRMYPNLDLFGSPTLVINRDEFEEVRKKWLDDPEIRNVLDVTKWVRHDKTETKLKISGTLTCDPILWNKGEINNDRE